MIRLEVEEYCHDCLDFTPDVTAPARIFSANNEAISYTDTVVQCKYRKRCSSIERYLRQRQAKDEVSG